MRRSLFGMRNRRRIFNGFVLVFILLAALMFLMPTVLTIANSFMTSSDFLVHDGHLLLSAKGPLLVHQAVHRGVVDAGDQVSLSP